MAQLVFRCPYTNQPIPSGIECGKSSLEVSLDYPISLRCPHCGSADTELLSRFSSTACKALRRCLACREPFDHFKELR